MSWFMNLRTAAKLMLSFAVVCVITAVVGYVGITRLATVDGLLSTMFERDLHGLVDLKEANIELVTVGRETRRAVSMPDPADIQRMAQEMERHAAAFDENMGQAEKTLITPEGKALAAEVRSAFPQYVAGCRECIQAALQHKPEQVVAALKNAKSHADKVDAALKSLCQTKEKLAEAAHEQSQATVASAKQLLTSVIVAAMAIAMLLGWWLSRIIVDPMRKAVQVLDSMANGDFTAHLDVDTKDEVGQMGVALNRAVESVRETLVEVQSVAQSVASASKELSSASGQLASGAQEQASSLEETAASLEEITSTIKHNSDNAQQASQLAIGSREIAEQGGQVVGQAVTAMREIKESSKKIGDIITTIDELAFQTNLLALNAAVEAARAGEQGRGFAVVAAEVRNLARRSATAAKEITAMINDSVRNIEAGSDLVTRSGHSLNEIVTSVKRVTDIVAEIAAASREQSSGIDQVTVAVNQMDQVTQSNASQTEELSSTAESLATQGAQLQAQVARFHLGVPQERFARTSTPPARKPVTKRSPVKAAVRKPNAPVHVPSAPAPDPAFSDLDAPLPAGSSAGFEEF